MIGSLHKNRIGVTRRLLIAVREHSISIILRYTSRSIAGNRNPGADSSVRIITTATHRIQGQFKSTHKPT